MNDYSIQVSLQGLFTGRPEALPRDGRLSAIGKIPTRRALRLNRGGLETDAQADLRVHGGEDRALCHYPAEHYRHWIRVFSESERRFLPGGFGENLSTEGLTEADVAIGDVFTLGTAHIQVSQPRMPCWKLGHYLDVEELPRAVVDTGRSGWLYRVLETGLVRVGDTLKLVDREDSPVLLEDLWTVHHQVRPEEARLERLASLDSLAQVWRRRFAARLAWLRKRR